MSLKTTVWDRNSTSQHSPSYGAITSHIAKEPLTPIGTSLEGASSTTTVKEETICGKIFSAYVVKKIEILLELTRETWEQNLPYDITVQLTDGCVPPSKNILQEWNGHSKVQ